MGMATMEVSEEEEPWILPKPALITVVVSKCLQRDASKVSALSMQHFIEEESSSEVGNEMGEKQMFSS